MRDAKKAVKELLAFKAEAAMSNVQYHAGDSPK